MNDSEDGRVQQLSSLGKNDPTFWGLREGSWWGHLESQFAKDVTDALSTQMRNT